MKIMLFMTHDDKSAAILGEGAGDVGEEFIFRIKVKVCVVDVASEAISH